MGWEEEMSDTAVQRRMADLEAAGINPILAGDFTATTPTGTSYQAQSAQAQMNNPYAEILANKQQKATTDTTKKQGQKAAAETTQTKELTPVLKKQAQTASAKNEAETTEALARATAQDIENKMNLKHPTLHMIKNLALPIITGTTNAIGSIGNTVANLHSANKANKYYGH